MQRFIAIHLLNDHSGSPLVFRQSLETLSQKGNTIHLFTATPEGQGFLSDMPGINYHGLPYRWSPNKILTLFYFLWSQLFLFWKLSFFLKRSDTVYINTLLPFGAALAAYWRGCTTIYHLHETSIKPALLKNTLSRVASFTASKFIFVSEYLSKQYAFPEHKTCVIYNALPVDFERRAKANQRLKQSPFTVLMLCSLKKYKGIEVFVESARRLPHIQFELVLNASQAAIDQWATNQNIPSNCQLFATQSDTHAFYHRAHLVLNLSLPDQWVETFGMTILEAMTYGLPVIVPPVGGVRELVEDGKEGFWVDARQPAQIAQAIELLRLDQALYQAMSEQALQKSGAFSNSVFSEKIRQLFTLQLLNESPIGKSSAALIDKTLPPFQSTTFSQ